MKLAFSIMPPQHACRTRMPRARAFVPREIRRRASLLRSARTLHLSLCPSPWAASKAILRVEGPGFSRVAVLLLTITKIPTNQATPSDCISQGTHAFASGSFLIISCICLNAPQPATGFQQHVNPCQRLDIERAFPRDFLHSSCLRS